MLKARMSSSSEEVIPAMIVLALLCVMVPSLWSTLNCCPGHPLLEVATIPGPNGLGIHSFYWLYFIILKICIRIFRTDYGHTEVAAHFGNG